MVMRGSKSSRSFILPSSLWCRNAPHNTRIEVGVDVRTAPNAQVLVFWDLRHVGIQILCSHLTLTRMCPQRTSDRAQQMLSPQFNFTQYHPNLIFCIIFSSSPICPIEPQPPPWWWPFLYQIRCCNTWCHVDLDQAQSHRGRKGRPSSCVCHHPQLP